MSIDLQIKICGITTPEQAENIARLGADAIGLVFFQKSPRNVSIPRAKEIVAAVKGECITCGVFVDMELECINHVLEETELDIAQLHGSESEEYIKALRLRGKKTIKVLKNETFAEEVNNYTADAYLLELGKGALPGGNFQSWEWQKAGSFGIKYPYVLAGGISSTNVMEAITQGNPQAIDVSSSVESSPGIKDFDKVREIIDIVHSAGKAPHPERIFS